MIYAEALYTRLLLTVVSLATLQEEQHMHAQSKDLNNWYIFSSLAFYRPVKFNEGV